MKKAAFGLLVIGVLMLWGCEAETPPPPKENVRTEDFSLLGMYRKMDWTFGLGEDFVSPESQASDMATKIGEEDTPNRPREIAGTNANENKRSANEMDARKIIRNGKLTLEIEKPAEGQQKIIAVAQAHDGFVVSSEFNQLSHQGVNQSVEMVVRIPASQFNQTLSEIQAVGLRVIFENVTGQDVTEEFLDLEARIKTQKALEEQLLQLMKKTGTVINALEVQRELTSVRTEIEKLIGRKQFLENQSALSTIAILLQTPAAIVSASTSGTGDKFKRAFADGIRIALGIVLLLIRFLFAAVPILLFVVLPFRFLRKRWRRPIVISRAANSTPQTP